MSDDHPGFKEIDRETAAMHIRLGGSIWTIDALVGNMFDLSDVFVLDFMMKLNPVRKLYLKAEE
jgi:hypothetical protein